MKRTNEIEARDAAMLVLGGIRAMDRLNKVIDGEVMRTMILFQDNKLFEPFGFTRMADFLEGSPLSPMTKNQFYDRKELFEKEGEHVFDLLNSAKIPLSVRKRLGAGNVQIDGDKVIVKDDAHEIAIDLNNQTGLVEALTALADKLNKGQNDYKKLKERLVNIGENPDTDTKPKPATGLSTLEQIHTVAIGGLAALAAELEKASDAECLSYADGQIALLASQFNRINTVLSGKIGVDSIATLSLDGGDDDGNRLADLLDD